MVTLFSVCVLLLSACSASIFDDLEDCPQGVYVKFHTMTPCATEPSYIGKVPSLTLFAFDDQDKLVYSLTEKDVNLTADYEVLVPVANGYYTFIAWAGLNDHFTAQNFTVGTTTKTEVMTQLKVSNGLAPSLKGTQVWQGTSSAVFLPNPKEYASYYEHTTINLRELTNRVKLIVEFDKATMTEYDPEKVYVEVSSANGTYQIDGTMPVKQASIIYPAVPTYNDNVATWEYDMMDLQTGYDNNLHIYYTGNKPEGETVYKNDLIALILLAAKNGNASLACDNDFEVKVVIKDYCVECWTHFSCSIYINDWHVHSYSTEL